MSNIKCRVPPSDPRPGVAGQEAGARPGARVQFRLSPGRRMRRGARNCEMSHVLFEPELPVRLKVPLLNGSSTVRPADASLCSLMLNEIIHDSGVCEPAPIFLARRLCFAADLLHSDLSRVSTRADVYCRAVCDTDSAVSTSRRD